MSKPMGDDTAKAVMEFRAQLDYQARQMLKKSLSYLPRSITFAEVQVGDTIRAEKPTGIVRVIQGKVVITHGDAMHIVDEGSNWPIAQKMGWSLMLVDRPEPDRPVGSLWYDPVTDAGYVATDRPSYVAFSGPRRGSGGSTASADSPLAKRLVPWADRPDASQDAS